MQLESDSQQSPAFHIALIAKSKTDTLLETVSFLNDFNIAYELARLASDDAYRGFSFSSYVWMRNGRPLHSNARLRVVRLKETSPVELVAAVAAASTAALTAVLILVKIIEKAYNIPLNHRKLKADVEKAERDNRIAAALERRNHQRHAQRILEDSAASPYLENTVRRLSRSTVVVREIAVTIETEEGIERDG